MGNCARADIFFGVMVPEDYKDVDDGAIEEREQLFNDLREYEWGSRYLEALGEADPDNRNLSATFRNQDIAAAKSGCEVGDWGYEGDRNYFVAIKESHILNTWDNPDVLSPEKFVIKPEWVEKLRDFCQKMKIPFTEPKWLIVSSIDP